MLPSQTRTSPKVSVRQRFSRILKRTGWILIWIVVGYFAIVVVGLIPVNNDFQPPPEGEGVEIFLVSNPVHSDIVLPIRSETVDWYQTFPPESFAGDTRFATHIAIGWGDRGFYIETPEWSDLKLSTAARALFWNSDCALHVSVNRGAFSRENSRSVRISVEQYQALVDYVQATLKRDTDGSTIGIEDAAYGQFDAFFEAHGNYHCFNTCNSWIGAAMRAAGLRTARLTPLPRTVFLYLPEPQDSL
jgi:uncharacterized protein (TIGR02117 family)